MIPKNWWDISKVFSHQRYSSEPIFLQKSYSLWSGTLNWMKTVHWTQRNLLDGNRDSSSMMTTMMMTRTMTTIVDHHYSVGVPILADYDYRNHRNWVPIPNSISISISMIFRIFYANFFLSMNWKLTCLIGIRLIDGVICPSCNKLCREFCSALLIRDWELVGAFESAECGDGDPPLGGRLMLDGHGCISSAELKPVGMGSD